MPFATVDRMKLPFVKHFRHLTIVVDRGIMRDWRLDLHGGIYRPPFNKGAGYKGGFTLYVCWNCVDSRSMYRPRRRLQVGITRNANRVPWTRH